LLDKKVEPAVSKCIVAALGIAAVLLSDDLGDVGFNELVFRLVELSDAVA
jgi:hypothetical protein